MASNRSEGEKFLSRLGNLILGSNDWGKQENNGAEDEMSRPSTLIGERERERARERERER